MKKHLTKSLLLLLLSAAVCSLNSCRKEETGTPSSGSGGGEGETAGTVKGFFLLNEGNQGSNKASLDYFDYETGVYTKNIYPERNPGVVKELGDLGNDLQVYGEKLYAVIGGSGLVEVMDVNTAKHGGQISVPSGRRLAFKDQYVYISSYAGPLNFDPNARKGYVARVDTAQLGKVDTCVVGYQPEDIVVSGNKLYVANSGGYRAPVYDSTVSVIDLSTFKEIYKINVAINIQKMRLDRSGNLWVSTPGNYYDIPSRTFVIDTKTDKVTDTLEVPNANMALRGDSLLLYSATWDMTTGKSTYSFTFIDTRTKKDAGQNFIKDGTDKNYTAAYEIAVNPDNGDFFVTDAKDYITPGKIYCYGSDGRTKWSATTGDIPGHIAFTHKKLQPLK